MSAAQFVNELEEMPVEARQQVVRSVLAKLYPRSAKAIERLLRRIEHPEVPDDVWEGFEEVAQPKFWKNYRKLSASQQQSARTLGNSCERASGLPLRRRAGQRGRPSAFPARRWSGKPRRALPVQKTVAL